MLVVPLLQLNALGQMAHACWQRLPSHFPNLVLDTFVVMPNHVHGILVLTEPSRRGAALGQSLEGFTRGFHPNAAPSNPSDKPEVAFGLKMVENANDQLPNAAPNFNSSESGVAFGLEMVENTNDQLSNAAPLPARLVAGSAGAIVLNFKAVTTRAKNRIQRSSVALMWQRNYHEHIVRDEAFLYQLRQHIQNNPLSWQEDQLHLNVPSKWYDDH